MGDRPDRRGMSLKDWERNGKLCIIRVGGRHW